MFYCCCLLFPRFVLLFLHFLFSGFRQGVAERLVDMVADVSKEANEVFGYADDASTGGDQLG